MAHHHDHAHGHYHSHFTAAGINGQVHKALKWGIILNLAFVCFEFTAGYFTQSSSLLADASHNFNDVISLALAWFAIWVARVKPQERLTYGYRKLSILISVINAFALVAVAIGIGYHAFEKILHPVPIQGGAVSLVAFIGILINAGSAWLFQSASHQDINVKGAYLHLLLDALISLGVVISGLLVSFTNALWLDPLVSILIGAIVFISSWKLILESVRLALDGVPYSIQISEVKQQALQIEGVADMHHIHIWPISTNEFALTAHLGLKDNISLAAFSEITTQLKHKLLHLNIQHVTLEAEYGPCAQPTCAHF